MNGTVGTSWTGELRSAGQWLVSRVARLGPQRDDFRAMTRDPRRDIIAGITVVVLGASAADISGNTCTDPVE